MTSTSASTTGLSCHVAARRRAAGLTQLELSAITGIPRKALLAIERGERMASVEEALCIADALALKVEDLFCRTACGVALPRRKSGRGWVLDLTGRRFGRLVVISRDKGRHSHRGEAHWLCRCDCGGLSVVRSDHLRSGHTASCGCRAVGPDGKEIKPGQAM